MPYLDKEIKREYQRNWLAKKKITNKDGSVNLTHSTATPEDMAVIASIEKIKTWVECVKLGKSLLKNKRINNLQIATIAIKACEIKHGGTRKPGWEEEFGLTLKQYAKSINMHHKTLNDWVRIKTQIVDRLTDREKSEVFNIGVATHVIRKVGKKDLLTEYRKYNKDNAAFKFSTAISYLKSVESSLKNHGIVVANKDDMVRFFNILESINSHVAAFKRTPRYKQITDINHEK